MCYRDHVELEFLETGGCIVWGPEHARLRMLAVEYVENYNSLVVRELEKSGKTSCSADVDWEGAFSTIKGYLRTDKRRERGVLSLGPAEIHIHLNRFSSRESVAREVCTILRDHNLDRDIPIVITPRDVLQASEEPDQEYKLTCRLGAVTPNNRSQQPAR